ncbi:inverse autotransporter beta domain-containing protein, partial [Candidatus Pelagibacter bacterium]|nr:inverse autotransporter beta domain-containing protein [Candidatus Pelagibacter bacterium]
NNKSSGNINEEITINIGLGTRQLINDNKMLVGLNAFYDIDAFATHERLSYGFEAKSAVLEFTANKYEGINSSGSEEFVLSGHDYKLSSQIPYLHWAKISATGYVWDGQDGKSDIEGSKYGTEMQLTKTFSLDVKYDDKDAEGLEDEYETNLTFNWPPKEGATALDGISSTAWNSDKDMSKELLDKVDRNNKIVVQYNGTATISRAN